jgi:hypothetical protein
MKQALEDRNFRVLYALINRAMELRVQDLFMQTHEVAEMFL